MRNLLIRVSLLLVFVTGNLWAQDPFWSPRMLQVAEPRSSHGWIYLKKELNIQTNEFIRQYGALIGLTQSSSLHLLRENTDEIGVTHRHYEQRINDLPVIGTRVSFHEKDGRLFMISGEGARPEPTGQAKADPGAMITQLKRYLHNEQITSISNAEVVYLADRNSDRSMKAMLCYRFKVKSAQGTETHYYLDVYDGSLKGKLDQYMDCVSHTANTVKYGNVTIFTKNVGLSNHILHDDCGSEQFHIYDQLNDTLDGTKSEYLYSGGSSWPLSYSTGTQTLFCMDRTNRYYKNVHGRISFSNLARTDFVYANYRFKDVKNNVWYTNNARFSSDTIYFGAPAAGVNENMAVMDIAAHEYTHGVTWYTSQLQYWKEMGAINESFSDIFGESAEYYTLMSCNWLVGTETGSSIRSFINPNTYGQPSYYYGPYWHSVTGTTAQDSADNFGVHTNSGVQNYMFYLLVNGGNGVNYVGNPVTVQGLGMVTARTIAYYALENYVGPNTDYSDARKAWLNASDILYGWCGFEHQQVAYAWDAVGVIDNTLGAIAGCGTFPYTSGGSLVNSISAQSYIIAGAFGCTNTIVNTAPVSYSASQYISLLPGFHATAGCNFSAYLDECNIGLFRNSPATASGLETTEENISTENRIEHSEFSASMAPNPFNGECIVTLHPGEEHINGEIRLCDETGRIVRVNTVQQDDGSEYVYKLSGADLPSGIYFIEFRNDKGLKWRNKLVKM